MSANSRQFSQRFAAFCAAMLGLATPLAAQQVRGTVTDSLSRRPIPGAVLILRDSSGATLGRNITNERGEFVLAGIAQARTLHVQRIGFRPRDLVIPPAVNGVIELSFAMMAIPTFLEPVRVTASHCPQRSDQGSALALLEQARAGLLTAVVAREAKPASMILFTFERLLEGTSDKIDEQTVHLDSIYRMAVSFSAAHNAAEFVRRGFMQIEPDGDRYFAPDADVLLDDQFSSGYCFRVMERNRARPNQVGLGFFAADKRRDRVDIDGALWIDTVARALRDIEFRYVGLGPGLEHYQPGGRIVFREMSNGTVLVDRWSLRLIGGKQDTVRSPDVRGRFFNVRTVPYASETGGELGHAVWRDGTEWHAPLGVADIRAVRHDRRPASGVELGATGTPYHATTDSAGRAVLRDLVTGPYSIVAFDSTLSSLHLAIPTGLSLSSQRDSLVFSAKVPTLEEFVLDRCTADGMQRVTGLVDPTLVIARVMDRREQPLDGISWRATVFPDGGGAPVVVREDVRTSADG
ncbi:MAG TPA: carboxypeptidase-like regulatory domain-containing protein, partial [Gemmatimonadaceae bacterium]